MSRIPEDLPISDARDHFADVLGRATYAGQITYITKRGRRVGAVVPVAVAEAAEAAEDALPVRPGPRRRGRTGRGRSDTATQ